MKSLVTGLVTALLCVLIIRLVDNLQMQVLAAVVIGLGTATFVLMAMHRGKPGKGDSKRRSMTQDHDA